MNIEHLLDEARALEESNRADAQGRVDRLQKFLSEADALVDRAEQRVAALESQLEATTDQVKIATYDLQESQEKLEHFRARAESEGQRADLAAEEVCRAWSQAEALQEELKKAQERNRELESLVERFTPKDNDALLEFL